jgi:hypothetical protein
MLAMYCDRLAHQASVGLAIAAGGNEDDLIRFRVNPGAMLLAKSRETPHLPRLEPHRVGRRRITLASGARHEMTSKPVERLIGARRAEIAGANR